MPTTIPKRVGMAGHGAGRPIQRAKKRKGGRK